jgi:hypothetical protein
MANLKVLNPSLVDPLIELASCKSLLFYNLIRCPLALSQFMALGQIPIEHGFGGAYQRSIGWREKTCSPKPSQQLG